MTSCQKESVINKNYGNVLIDLIIGTIGYKLQLLEKKYCQYKFDI